MGAEICNVNVDTSIFHVGNFALQKLWYVDNDCKYGDGEEVREEAAPMRCCVRKNLIIVEWVIHCYVALRGGTNSHEYGPSHGDEVDWVEEVREHEDMEICFKPQYSHGFQKHCDQVQKVKAG